MGQHEVTTANSFAEADTPLQLLQLLAGAASMCWENPGGAGRYQPEAASCLCDAALERLIELGWA